MLKTSSSLKRAELIDSINKQMKSTYTEHFKVDEALFKDCASTSHGCFGSFTGSLKTELVLLRGLESLELYRADPTLCIVSTYKMEN